MIWLLVASCAVVLVTVELTRLHRRCRSRPAAEIRWHAARCHLEETRLRGALLVTERRTRRLIEQDLGDLEVRQRSAATGPSAMTP